MELLLNRYEFVALKLILLQSTHNWTSQKLHKFQFWGRSDHKTIQKKVLLRHISFLQIQQKKQYSHIIFPKITVTFISFGKHPF
jgi:hypothetical protein